MGNYPTTREIDKNPNFDPFAQTYGSATDEYAQFYSRQGGLEVELEKGSVEISKIYSMDGEIWFFDHQHKRQFLTDDGKLKPNAKELVKKVQGYGSGPMVWVGGSMTEPTYMVSMTDIRVDKWEMVSFKSWKGLSHAVTGLWRDPMKQDTYHRQHLGSASINIFEKHRATTMFLDGVKMNKAIDQIGQGTLTMMVEGVLDAFTMGAASPIIETTGLGRLIDKAQEDLYQKMYADTGGSIEHDFTRWNYKHENATNIGETANKIKDERLDFALEKIDKMAVDFGLDVEPWKGRESTAWFGVLKTVTGFYSPRSKIRYLRKQSHAVTIKAVDQKTKAFKKTLNIAKHLTPEIDISMFDFSGRLTPEERFVQLNKYSADFQKNVMPSLKVKYQRMKDSGQLPSLKVKPTSSPIKEEKPSVDQQKLVSGDRENPSNIKNSGKIISGQPKKTGWHVNIMVNG